MRALESRDEKIPCRDGVQVLISARWVADERDEQRRTKGIRLVTQGKPAGVEQVVSDLSRKEGASRE